MRLAAFSLALFYAVPALALPTQDELLQAATCIGFEDGSDLAGERDYDAKVKNPQQRRDFAFESLVGLPNSPGVGALRAAREEGIRMGSQTPDPFAPVIDAVNEVDSFAKCVILIERLGLTMLVYPY